MPLTAAEKQKRYREKLRRENPEKYALMKKKTAECSLRYYRKRAKEFTENERKERRKKWRDERRSLKKAQNDEAIKKDHKYSDLRKENYAIKRDMVILRKQYQALRKKYYRQSKILDKLSKAFQEVKEKYQEITIRLKETSPINEECEVNGVDNETPMKQAETFIKNNLTNIDESKKELVKRKLLEHSVLSESLKEEYKKSVGIEKNILKKVVTNEIVKKYKLKDKLKHTLGLKSNIRKNRDRQIRKNKLLNEINTFYNRDDNSRATAGKKEYKTKNKVKLQRRYLLTTIKKLHEKYLSEGGKVSLSTFKKYRPFNILTPKITNRDTCACVKHSNMAFMVKKLKQLGILKTDNLNDVVSQLVCDTTSKTCMYGFCETCKDNTISEPDETDFNLNDKIVWPVWMSKKHEYGEEGNKKTSNKMVKTEKEGSIQDLINNINFDLKKFLNHMYNISHQYKNYKFCIDNLNENETVIHIDFSENYICKMHTEIQAMHFGSSKVQITLHTGVLYIKNEKKPSSFCSICPANTHNPEAIWAHLKPILQHLKESYPQIDTIHFFSDGPTSQYRNKKNFYLFSQIQSFGFKHATWSIFEASHGKGAADGIGGAIKRTLDSKVAHGEDIPDAKTAFEVLSKTDSAIKVYYIPPEDIKPLPEELVKRLNPLPNTLKVHQVILNEINSVRYRDLSCFCNKMSGKCDCYSIKIHNFEISNENSQKNITKKKDTRKIKKRRNSSSSTSTDESFEIECLDDSDATHFSPEYLEEEYLDVEKVTILSDIRNLPCNKGYFDLKQFKEQEFHKINLNFDLFSGKKPLDVSISAEKVNLCTNSIPSTSRINNRNLNNFKDSLDYNAKELCLSAEEGKQNMKMKERSKEKNSDSEKSEKQENFLNLTQNDAVRTGKIGQDFDEEMEYPDFERSKINENIEDCEESFKPLGANENDKTEDLEYNEGLNIINQNVLVRYYIRNNWKYYIGRVEEINTVEDKYTINFLKTVKTPSLKFVVTKKIDRDTVPSISIVKRIELITSDKKNEYLLRDNFDVTYFK